MASWLEDPAVAHIDKEKLDFLQMLVFESRGLTKEQMLPFLMAVAKRGRDKQISFTQEEIDTIISVLQKYAAPEELEMMNKMVAMYRKKN
ncbi:MAG: hypothetical protein NC314_09450 [Roseburia sp.]|nr:hypothetical protein [Ruminococcus sp.]MCM1155884.1 hypothetical protein [Roseburia sp.]MCM1243053.1 hypothetical protein [Roseburia sp.]